MLGPTALWFLRGPLVATILLVPLALAASAPVVAGTAALAAVSMITWAAGRADAVLKPSPS